MIKPFLAFFRMSFRFQLIYGIGLFLTFLIALFITIQTLNNNKITREREVLEATEHSRALASMVKVWVMSNDYVGLDEALENFSVYDNLVFAAVISIDGKVIAHTDKSLVGKYVADKERITYLQQMHHDEETTLSIYRNGNEYIDVLRPIHNGKEHLGLVHLRLDQYVREKMISDRIYQGIGFGALYLIITVLVLYWIVRKVTRQLESLLETMRSVHSGNKEIRASEEGYDELAELSHEFNSMLDAITAGETQLTTVKERLEYAVNGTNDGIWDWDIQTNEVYFSPRWKEMLGYSDSELPNLFSSWAEHVHPEDLETAKQEIELCHRGPGILYSHLHRMRHKDGHWVWILARGKTIFEGNKPVRMVGFHTDMTKQKELEQQLFEREEMMIAQSRHVAMGEMIGMIAHQWRQPITAIAMGANNILLDIALGDLDGEHFEKEAKLILNQTEHLSKTIDDFRNFFRPNKDKDDVKVVDVLLETKQIMGKSLEYHNIDFSITSDETESIRTYSRELLQVCLNILKNAQEAIEEKVHEGGRISADIHNRQDELVITISDNGGGIDPNILQRIFEPYFSTKGKKSGTGLGLYMSKTIIEKHLNGTITAENIEGGVRFVMVLPKHFDTKQDNE